MSKGTTNKWLKIILANFGYQFKEIIDVKPDGKIYCFVKKIDDIFIHFQYYWDKRDWYGRLSIHHDFEPANNLLHPIASLEINHILKSHIENLLEYEMELIIWKNNCRKG